jgi:hypothetical protein
MKLTAANVRSIERGFIASGKADRIVFDDDLPGLGFRLQGDRRASLV